jgi:hypothetical protein
MKSAPAANPASADARISSRISLLMFCCVAGTCLSLSALARSETVKHWIRLRAWNEAGSKKIIPYFSFTDHFPDTADRVIHVDIPGADFSRGGVYVTGASDMTWAVRAWEAPIEARSLFHNFAIRGMNSADEFDVFRFLVERRGLLAAGGKKSLVIIGVSYHRAATARMKADQVGGAFSQLWTRYGCYSLESGGAIHERKSATLDRGLRLARAQLTGLLHEIVGLVIERLKSPRVLDGDSYNAQWKQLIGENWNEKLHAEVRAFTQLVEYLRSRNVKVVTLRMPAGSWESKMPFEASYIAEIRKTCEKYGVEIIDCSKLLDDDDFANSNHFTTSGIEKFEYRVFQIGLDHLRSVGLLP